MSLLNLHPKMSVHLLQQVEAREPVLWINDARSRTQSTVRTNMLCREEVELASKFLERCRPLIVALFPEAAKTNGLIESSLRDVTGNLFCYDDLVVPGRVLMKCDHALPVVGSIKARGGFYEVLRHAYDLAISNKLIPEDADPLELASPTVREAFRSHEIVVGSTGNLGLSIGTISVALGFQAVIHMSRDAKDWKRRRLRHVGATVVEHVGDYGAAVSAGRSMAREVPDRYFIDDECSVKLILGYSTAAQRLQEQLNEAGVEVSSENPLFVYIPCGVGGAPGGITLGCHYEFGDNVHCFFAEPVAAPCMLLRLASCEKMPVSKIGLDGRTVADGLAVGQASELAATLIEPLVAGVFTVTDEVLFEWLYLVERRTSERLEPSAAAGIVGPQMLLRSEMGRKYLAEHKLEGKLDQITHVIWTTGGSMMPDIEFQGFLERGRECVGRN